MLVKEIDAAELKSRIDAGEDIALHYFRHGVLHETELTVRNAAADTALLCILDRNLLAQWLQTDGYSG